MWTGIPSHPNHTWRAVLQQVDGGGREQRLQVLVRGTDGLLDARVLRLVNILGHAVRQALARVSAWACLGASGG